MNLLIDSGVNRSLISEQDWNKIKLIDGEKPVLKKCDIKFSPFGTKYSLPMMGRTRALLRNEQGGVTRTVVCVVKGEKQSLLGLKDARALGIVKIDPAGESSEKIEKMEPVRTLSDEKKLEASDQGVVSGGETQLEINQKMDKIVGRHNKVFKG